MFHKVRQGDPFGGVHVDMVLVLNILLIDLVRSDSLGIVSVKREEGERFVWDGLQKRRKNGPTTQKDNELVHKVLRKLIDVLARVFANDQHLPEVLKVDKKRMKRQGLSCDPFRAFQKRNRKRTASVAMWHLNPLSSLICFWQTWQYHLSRPSPLAFIAFATCLLIEKGKQDG